MNKNFGKSSIRRMMGANLPDRLTDIEQKLRERPIKSLRQLADLLPVLVGSRVISPVSSDNVDPEDAAFSGSGLAGDPITIADVLYSMFDIDNGEINFGVIPGQGFVGAGGAFRVTKDAVYFGDNVVFSFTDGLLYTIAAQILLDTTNFNKVLNLTGSGGYSPLSTGANGAIYGVAKDGSGYLHFVGAFTSIGGQAIKYYAVWNGTTFIKPYSGSLNGVMRAVAVVGSDVYIAGDATKLVFGLVAGEPSSPDVTLNYIAKCNGSSITALTAIGGTGANNPIYALAANGTTLYAGGAQTSMLGTAGNRVHAIDTTGPTAAALSTGLDGTIYSLLYSTDLYAGGAQTGKVSKYSGGAWATHGTSGPNNTIYALAKTGNDLYAVGAQTSPGNYISKCTSGGAWAAVGSGLAGIGYAVAIDGSNIIAGFSAGEYVQYYDGTWHSLGSGVNGNVYSILVDTTWVIAGAYTTADGNAMYRISRYSVSTAPSALLLQTAMDMLDDHEHYYPLTGHVGGTFGSGVTEYSTLGRSGTSATESDEQIYLPAGTIKGFHFVTKTAQHGLGSLVATIMEDGSPTALAITVPTSGGAGTKSDTSTELVWGGGLFSIKWVNAAGGASASVRGVTVFFKPD